MLARPFILFFSFNYPATTDISTLSLHDALPISFALRSLRDPERENCLRWSGPATRGASTRLQQRASHFCPCPNRRLCKRDRKSTRLNSSHLGISYAVFCLKKKRIIQQTTNVHPT